MWLLLLLLLQKYLSRVFKGAMVCGLFAAIFQGQSNNNHTVHQVYVYIIKVGHILSLCTTRVTMFMPDLGNLDSSEPAPGGGEDYYSMSNQHLGIN